MAVTSLLQASCICCKECTWFAGGLGSPREWHIGWFYRKSYFPKLNITNLHVRKKLGKGFCGQTLKEESNGSTIHDPIHNDNHDVVGKSLYDDHDADDDVGKSLNDDHDVRKLKNGAECHVETISWRERRIIASILVEASPQKVWEVLTDYERLSEFIPNLVCSEKIPCPYPGRIWLLQRGMQRTMYWNIEARVVLDLKEIPYLETGSELHFSMVDGDFKRYEGKWYLRTGPRLQTTMLYYEVNVVPKLFFPAAFVESIIKADLPKNLCAIAKRAETELEADSKTPGVLEKAFPLMTVNEILAVNFEASAPATKHIHVLGNSSALLSSRLKKDDEGTVYEHGLSAVSLLGEAGGVIYASVSDWHWSGFGRSCQLGHHCFIDEIHFRRLDDLLENGGIHRQVVATITVKAPSKDVWAVLTAYENLPEFVPNLANSVVLSREKERVRLLQEGCKCLLYMVLHARVVLDLWERPEQEITFKQVEGDFDSFQGNWMLNQFGSQHTVLKYTVDTKIRKDCILAESIVEEVIYEDLPSNLCAIRDRVESLATRSSSSAVCLLEASKNTSLAECEQAASTRGGPKSSELKEAGSAVDCVINPESSTHKKFPEDPGSKPSRRRARVKGLMNDFRVLEEEIKGFIAAYGTEGLMPMRRYMRRHGRSDLEKAITAMGGFRTVATRMKLSLAYKEKKPVGYWDEVQNLRNEVISVQKEIGGDPTVLPSRLSIEKLGRYNLARALEKWGGSKETAKILGLKTLRTQKQAAHKQRSKKTTSAKHDGGSDHVKKPLLVGMVTPLDMKKEEEKQSSRDSLKGKKSYKRTVLEASPIMEEASQQPSRIHAAAVSSSTHEELLQDLSEKDVSQASNSTKEPPQNAFNDSYPSSSNQVKHKKMPYKTDVPQESPKWLTLFTDAAQPGVADD